MQVSTDGGRTWFLVARISVPAVEVSQDEAAVTPGIVRTGPTGIVAAVGTRRVFRISGQTNGAVPRDTLSLAPAGALAVLDAVARSGRTTLWLETGSRPVPVFDGYTPSDDDIVVFGVSPALADLQRIAQLVNDAARTYDDEARRRLVQANKRPVTGYLTVVARPAEAQSGGSIMFLLNGSPVAIVNRPPYSVRWDSRDWPDGEHLVEVRVLDRSGAAVSRAKSLVYVQNRGSSG